MEGLQAKWPPMECLQLDALNMADIVDIADAVDAVAAIQDVLSNAARKSP